MMSEDLLIPIAREYDYYKAMKRGGKSTTCLSEYLFGVCERKSWLPECILFNSGTKVPIGDYIRDAYNNDIMVI